jgi:hypothetical protein
MAAHCSQVYSEKFKVQGSRFKTNEWQAPRAMLKSPPLSRRYGWDDSQKFFQRVRPTRHLTGCRRSGGPDFPSRYFN